MARWTTWDQRWRNLDDYGRAAVMSLMEADGMRLPDAINAAGAMVNRSQKLGEPLGKHVSRSIYQPTIERSQQKRLGQILNSPKYEQMRSWVQDRVAGKIPDPVQGATHFLAPERTMLALERGNPSKYRSWRKWTNFDPSTNSYRGTIMRDGSHAFLAPEGAFSAPGQRQGPAIPKETLNQMADAVLPPSFEPTQVASAGGFAPQSQPQAPQVQKPDSFIINSSKPLFDAANQHMKQVNLDPSKTPGYRREAMPPQQPPRNPIPQGQLNPGYRAPEIKPVEVPPLRNDIPMQDGMISRMQKDFTPTNPNDPFSSPAHQKILNAPIKPVEPGAFSPPTPLQGDSLLRPGGATSQMSSPRAMAGNDPSIMGPDPQPKPQPPAFDHAKFNAMVPPPEVLTPPQMPPMATPPPNPVPTTPAPSGGSGGAGTLVAGASNPATSGPKAGGFSMGGLFGGLANLAQSMNGRQQQAEQINSQAIKQAEQQGQQMMQEDAQQRQMLAQRTQQMNQFNDQRENYEKQLAEWRRQQMGAFGRIV